MERREVFVETKRFLGEACRCTTSQQVAWQGERAFCQVVSLRGDRGIHLLSVILLEFRCAAIGACGSATPENVSKCPFWIATFVAG